MNPVAFDANRLDQMITQLKADVERLRAGVEATAFVVDFVLTNLRLLIDPAQTMDELLQRTRHQACCDCEACEHWYFRMEFL